MKQSHEKFVGSGYASIVTSAVPLEATSAAAALASGAILHASKSIAMAAAAGAAAAAAAAAATARSTMMDSREQCSRMQPRCSQRGILSSFTGACHTQRLKPG